MTRRPTLARTAMRSLRAARPGLSRRLGLLALPALLSSAVPTAGTLAAAGLPAPAPPAMAAGAWVLPPERNPLRPAPGEDLIRANCVLCHSTDYITTQPRLSTAQWRAEVEKMRGKFGAPITTNAIPGLVAYLAANYGAAK